MPQEVLNILLSALGVVVTGLASWGVAMLQNELILRLKIKKLQNLLIVLWRLLQMQLCKFINNL